MKVRNLLVVIMTLVLATGLYAQASMANSAHDLSAGSGGVAATSADDDQLCIFCHTPHTTAGQNQLWNKNPVDATAWNTTNSGTGSANNIGTTACLSCHDGTTSMGTVLNDTTSGGTGSTITLSSVNMGSAFGAFGTDLSGEHPVGVIYATAQGAIGGLHVQGTAASNLGIPTASLTTVECVSCHDPHDTSNGLFLRKDNSGSALCIACHDK